MSKSPSLSTGLSPAGISQPSWRGSAATPWPMSRNPPPECVTVITNRSTKLERWHVTPRYDCRPAGRSTNQHRLCVASAAAPTPPLAEVHGVTKRIPLAIQAVFTHEFVHCGAERWQKTESPFSLGPDCCRDDD